MSDGYEMHMHLHVPMQQMIDPVERTLRAVEPSAEGPYKTVKQGIPEGVRWAIFHPRSGDIGWIELHGDSADPEGHCKLLLLGTQWNVRYRPPSESKRAAMGVVLGQMMLLGGRVDQAWQVFVHCFATLLAARELVVMGVDVMELVPGYGDGSLSPGWMPGAHEVTGPRKDTSRQPQNSTKRRGGRRPGTGRRWSSSRAFLAALRPVMRELDRRGSITQERAAEKLQVQRATIKRYLRDAERDEGITWEQLINEATGY